MGCKERVDKATEISTGKEVHIHERVTVGPSGAGPSANMVPLVLKHLSLSLWVRLSVRLDAGDMLVICW